MFFLINYLFSVIRTAFVFLFILFIFIFAIFAIFFSFHYFLYLNSEYVSFRDYLEYWLR